jgi:hypothetical protein
VGNMADCSAAQETQDPPPPGDQLAPVGRRQSRPPTNVATYGQALARAGRVQWDEMGSGLPVRARWALADDYGGPTLQQGVNSKVVAWLTPMYL